MSSTHNALALVLTPALLDAELDGFTFVPSDGMPFITIDKHRRFYFNASLRKMFGLRAYSKVAIGYNADTKSIAIITKDVESVPPNFSYLLDKRHYASARKFTAENRINVSKGALTYVFERRTSVDGVFIFRLTDASAAKTVNPAPNPESIELIEGDRLLFADLRDCEIYVKFSKSPRQIEISRMEVSGAFKVYVDEGGLSDSIYLFAKSYVTQRPVTFDYFANSGEYTAIFRKAKQVTSPVGTE